MIANCGAMGLDWRLLSLSAYLEALEAHNEMQNPEGASPIGSPDGGERLAAVMKARTGG